MAALTEDDLAQIEAYGATATEKEKAEFRAELYKLRNAPSGSYFAGFPRAVVILIAIWFGLLETADKLPQLMLSYPRYQAALAEANAKLLQPDLVAAQLTKANNEALASVYQPDVTKYGLAKAKQEARASEWQSFSAAAQGYVAEAQFMSNGNMASSYKDQVAGVLSGLRP